MYSVGTARVSLQYPLVIKTRWLPDLARGREPKMLTRMDSLGNLVETVVADVNALIWTHFGKLLTIPGCIIYIRLHIWSVVFTS